MIKAKFNFANPTASFFAAMVLEKGFVIVPTASHQSRGKVALGAKRDAAGKGPSDLTEPTIPTTVALETLAGSASATDLQITRAYNKQGKAKAIESKVEEVIPLKRTKRPTTVRSSEL